DEVRLVSQRRPHPLSDHRPPSALVFLLFMVAVAAISLALPPVAQRLGSLVGSALGGVSESGRPWALFLLPAGILAAVMALALFSTRSRPNETSEPEMGRGLPPAGRTGSNGHFRTITADRPTTRFADVAGIEEAKEELAEVVDFL